MGATPGNIRPNSGSTFYASKIRRFRLVT